MHTADQHTGPITCPSHLPRLRLAQKLNFVTFYFQLNYSFFLGKLVLVGLGFRITISVRFSVSYSYILVPAKTGLVCHANWYQKPIPVSGTSWLVPETG